MALPRPCRHRVFLSAGDQRMQVSFGSNAAREPTARQTFPSFNNVYKRTIEWRLEALPNGKTRPFATILRWNVKLPDDERESTGRVLVVTRFGPGGVCHVGYVDARSNANELALQIADRNAAISSAPRTSRSCWAASAPISVCRKRNRPR